MKTKILYLFGILFVLSACKSENANTKVLSVSIDPQKYFLETIVGDKYTVNSLIPAGSNPEIFDPTPSQMVVLGKSLIYFKVGYLGFENTRVRDVQKNMPNLQIVDCSAGIQLVACDDHDHDHGHDHGHEGGDPHIWSSPKTAAIMARNMYEAVVKFDPANESYYNNNYTKLTAEIDSVDAVVRNYVAKADSKAFIIYHSALSYFAAEYGLEQYSIENEGKSPSPSQLKTLIDLAKEKNIKLVFVQEEYDQKNAQTIANEIGAKIVSINLLSYNWSDEIIKIAKSLALENE